MASGTARGADSAHHVGHLQRVSYMFQVLDFLMVVHLRGHVLSIFAESSELIFEGQVRIWSLLGK